jgi:arylformamidase
VFAGFRPKLSLVRSSEPALVVTARVALPGPPDPHPVWRTYTAAQLSQQYSPRSQVVDVAAVFEQWTKDGLAFREGHRALDLAYGREAAARFDLYRPADVARPPLVVFIHGGYWQALDGTFFSHLAAGLNAHGISVAIPGYDLCPEVTVENIVLQMRMATRALARPGRSLVISGHSAGGHLAACMLATDWPAFDSSLPKDLVVAAYGISGLFDLEPLVGTSINKALRLDAANARAVSPLFWRAPERGSLDAVVGANESSEYFRQSKSIVDRWGAAGVATRFGIISNANHFTAIAPLADPQSPMVDRLKELSERR